MLRSKLFVLSFAAIERLDPYRLGVPRFAWQLVGRADGVKVRCETRKGQRILSAIKRRAPEETAVIGRETLA